MQATHSLEQRTLHCKAPPQVDWHHCCTYLQLSRQSACATVATMHSAPATASDRNRIAHPPSGVLVRELGMVASPRRSGALPSYIHHCIRRDVFHVHFVASRLRLPATRHEPDHRFHETDHIQRSSFRDGA
jgi:hypothetical protein